MIALHETRVGSVRVRLVDRGWRHSPRYVIVCDENSLSAIAPLSSNRQSAVDAFVRAVTMAMLELSPENLG